MRLEFKDVTEAGWLPTAAVDGRRLYYNREFIDRLTHDELIFIIAHETAHVVYDHINPSRIKHRNRLLWNHAIDYVVNLELSDHKIGKFPNKQTCGIQGCLDTAYRGLAAEEVYELLEKSGTERPGSCFDEHHDAAGPDGQPLSEREQEELRQEIQSAIIHAARAAGTEHVPPSIKAALGMLGRPRISWREILRSQIKSTIKNDFTWSRCSRKTRGSDYYLPATSEQTAINIAVALDCSGSISDAEMHDMIAEVGAIMQEFTDFHIDLWCFDTEVHNHQVFSPFNLSELSEYQLTGGGGTRFECNWEYMQSTGIKPDKFIMMTDGMNSTSSWGDSTWCDAVFVIHGDPHHRVRSSHGLCIHHDLD